MERPRGRRRRGWRRVKDCLRQFVAFMFSNVGIVGLVVGYAIAGAFIFKAIEGGAAGAGAAGAGAAAVATARGRVVRKLWEATSTLNVFSEAEWRALASAEVAALQRVVVDAALESGLDASPPPVRMGPEGEADVSAENPLEVTNQWSFSGAFLYSLTVITTIGYGNVSPQTEWGKLATILYAIAGMPLFLLYLSNIGDILAKSFKWTYAQCCLCRWCSSSSTINKKKKGGHRHRKRRSSRVSLKKKEAVWSHQMGPPGDAPAHLRSVDGGVWPVVDSWPPEELLDVEMADDDVSDGDSEDSSSDEDTETEDLEDNSVVRETAGTRTESVTVPVSLCLAIMVGYVCGGALLFAKWEDWDFLDGSYFCFISLSTIGFGDIVPGDKITSGNGVELSFIFCSAYLMLGMALIAMCFSLMQEEVVHKMRGLMKAIKTMGKCLCGTRGPPLEQPGT